MQQTIDAMREEGNPFRGVLYGQFMITRKGMRVIEYNARFGDPEAMNVLMLLRTQLADIFQSMAEGNLLQPAFSTNCTAVKYLVPEGYPSQGRKDEKIEVNERAVWDCGGKLFFGSVYEKEGAIYTTSSRTAAAGAHDSSLEKAEAKAECCTRAVKGPVWHRPDIGTSELVKKRIEHIRRLKK
jgi:phosphoribosylamine--glycine ligase